ncbi:MAG: hypothetical protein IJ030_03150 [Oscillospiraceae bacterium]|nr:hypothetical protein [Oscillospiraceae bacterium]
MDILEKLRQFLLGFPGWDEALSADFTQDGPGCSGLYPAGVEEIARRTDLLGNTQVDYKCQFTLYKRMRPGQDSARWLLDFQNWLMENKKRIPQFGDGSATVQVGKAKAQEASRLGTGLCTVSLAVCFTKEYEREGQYADDGFVYS